MAKKQKGNRPGVEKDTTTFSTRLSAAQKERVERAAEIRGWTPSNLIRVAALEKSAHIINTSIATKFDFSSLAARVGNQLLKPRKWIEADPKEPNEEPPVFQELQTLDMVHDTYWPECSALSDSDVLLLKEAVRIGGAEFFAQLVEYCESITARDRGELPAPIEPDK